MIAPGAPVFGLWIAEAWRTRRIARLMAERSLRARYKQMLLGAGWAILQPLLLMLVFWVFFGTFLKVPTEPGVPYPLFAFTGLVLWQFFARALNDAGSSIVTQPHFVTKIYFPRVHLPVAVLLVATADLGTALVSLAVLMVIAAHPVSLALLCLPAILLLLALTSAGAAFWLSALTLRHRDIMQILPLLTQLLMFASPVIYPSSIVPEGLRGLYGLNPLVTIIEGARWAVLGTAPPAAAGIAASSLVAVVLFVTGLSQLRRHEPVMSDLV